MLIYTKDERGVDLAGQSLFILALRELGEITRPLDFVFADEIDLTGLFGASYVPGF